MKDDILNEVLSAIIEMKIELRKIPEFLQALNRSRKEIDTLSVWEWPRNASLRDLPHENGCERPGHALPERKDQYRLAAPFREA